MDPDIDIYGRARGRFFGPRLELADVCVEPDGSVRVYDDVAGYYTRVHRLTASARRRIVRQIRGHSQEED